MGVWILVDSLSSRNFNHNFTDKILIYGDNFICDFLKLYLVGLNFKNVIQLKPPVKKSKNLFSPKIKKSYFNNFFKDIICINHTIDSIFLDEVSMVVDCNNDFKQKELCVNLASKKNLPYILIQSNRHSFQVSLNSSLDKIYTGYSPGYFTSAFASAIALDEIRKNYYPLSDDVVRDGSLNYNLFNSDRNNLKLLKKFKPKTSEILLVGAGGIGSNLAINLALEGFVVNLYDYDNIEENNLNRQMFYYDNVGKNKAKTLENFCKKLKTKGKILAHSEKFSLNNLLNLKNYSVIVSCVDNWNSRKELNQLALLSNIPLLNLSVTTFSASSDFYVPNKSFCLECKYDINNKNISTSCSTLENNVITTNAAIAAFGTGEIISLINHLPQKYFDFKYYSQLELDKSFSYYNQNNSCNCGLSDCKCHRR